MISKRIQDITKDPIWGDVIKRAQAEEEQKRKSTSFSVRALNEAYDSKKAMQERSARLGRLLAISYLMLTETMELVDEAELMMDRDFRIRSGFKLAVKGMNKSFNDFYRQIVTHISASEMKNFANDLVAFDANVRSWGNLEGYKVATAEDKKNSIRERAKNLHNEFVEKMAELQELFGKEEVEKLLDELKKEK